MAILSSLSSRNIVPWKGYISSALDPYFKNTTLYIQNKLAPVWNSDSSTNNILLLENGTVRASAASPYNQTSGNWSNYFDGSSSITPAAGITTAMGSGFAGGKHTIECFVFPTFYAAGYNNNYGACLIGANPAVAANGRWTFALISNAGGAANLSFGWTIGTGSSDGLDSTGYQIPINQWSHVAVTIDATTPSSTIISLFINGSQVATKSNANFTTQTTYYGTPSIGTAVNQYSNSYYGYLSNFRILTGTTLYAGSYTVPTSPLTAIANTKLLICQNNTFVDNSTANSGSGFALTPSGTTVQAFNPFVATNVVGPGSGYFNTATSDYLTTPATANYNLAGIDFTVECWVYLTATGNNTIITLGTGGTSTYWHLAITSSGAVTFQTNTAGSWTWSNVYTTSGTPISVGSWYHIAAVRNSANFSIYVNGSSAYSTNSFVNPVGSAGTFFIGTYYNNYNNDGSYFRGYIADFRLVTGTAVYTGTFTPPTTQLPSTQPAGTNISTITSGTQLLTLQYSQPSNTNAFFDRSSRNILITRVGNTHQGSFSPFSNRGWSTYFNGAQGINVSIPASANYNLSTGQFCVEAFIFPIQKASGGNGMSGAYIISQGNNASNVMWGLAYDRTTRQISWGFTGQSVAVSTSYTVTYDTWNHIVVTRDSDNGERIFLNGVLINYRVNTTNYSSVSSYDTRIGSSYDTNYPGAYGVNAFGNTMNGFISNVRLDIGAIPTAYQTSSTTAGTTIFAVPNIALTATSNTKILTCQSNRHADNSVYQALFGINGAVYVQSFSPFNPSTSYNPATIGGSAYYDGSGDQLQSPRVFLASQPFTIEGWVYISGDVSSGTHVFWGSSNGGGGQPKLTVYITSNVLYTDIDGTPSSGPSVSSASTYIIRGTWNHIALCRSSTSAGASEIYINGISRATGTIGDRSAMTAVWQVGGAEGSVSSAGTYIANFRFSVGVRRYNTNFTSPTTLFTADQYTALLLTFNDAGFYDSAGRANFETVGFPQIVTTKKKNNLASTYISQRTATGDYFVTGDYTSTPIYDLGTGEFTVEAWINLSTLSFDNSNIAPIISYGNGGANGPLGLGTAWSLNITQGSPYSIVWYRNIDASTQYNNAFNLGAGDLVINTWQKIAVIRKSGLLAAFLNDQQVSVTLDNSVDYSSLSGANRLWAGIQTGGGGANQYYRFPGYIDDIRVTRGVSRYVPTVSRPTTFDYFVVGGGGGGGRFIGGGGGGGGVLSSATSGAYTLSVSSLTVTVGNGGGSNASGSNSVLGTLTATGGGQGGTADFGPSGQNGGSGGGGAAPNGTSGGTGVAGPPRQGYNGGSGQGRPGGGNAAAGGGGGAGAQGQNSQSDQQPGVGGVGITTTIITTGMATTNSVGVVSSGSVYFAAGGGGGGDGQSNTAAGGLGGGGTGYSNADGQSAPANTGSGGGGAGAPPRTGGSGGSGVVIMAYPSNFNNITTITGLTYVLDTTSRPGYKVYIFKSGSGTISW